MLGYMYNKQATCKYFGDERVFQRKIKDLKDLEENGVDVEPGVTLKAAVDCIVGDNLGSHYIGCFLESFSAEHSCRYCA
jgi:hypothetical protein